MYQHFPCSSIVMFYVVQSLSFSACDRTGTHQHTYRAENASYTCACVCQMFDMSQMFDR